MCVCTCAAELGLEKPVPCREREMSKITSQEETPSRKVAGALSVFSGAVLLLLLGWHIAAPLSPLPIFLFLTSLVLVTGFPWLYVRYRGSPLMRERRLIERYLRRFRKHALLEEQLIRATLQERNRLLEAERAEIERALEGLQRFHVLEGLETAAIWRAVIPGVDQTLKQQLLGLGIVSAAQITDENPKLSGIGEAERQALLDWRQSVLDDLDRTKPDRLGENQLQGIQMTYQALQEKNGVIEKRARLSIELLERELAIFRLRLEQLDRFTFGRFLRGFLFSPGWRPPSPPSHWS